MSWQTWVRATAARLGLAAPNGVTVQTALENLQAQEDRMNELRARLIDESARRRIYVEEAVAYDVARGNLYAATEVLRAEIVRLGVPATHLPIVKILAPLPQSITANVEFLPQPSGAALGFVRVGPGGLPRGTLGGSEWAGTLGLGPVAVVVIFAGVAIGFLAASTVFVYVLQDLVNPEVALQQAVSDSDIAIAEAWATGASEWEETRRAALENGIDPNTLTPPALPDLSRLGRGNPLTSGVSALKGVLWGLAALGALWVGYKVWKGKE